MVYCILDPFVNKDPGGKQIIKLNLYNDYVPEHNQS